MPTELEERLAELGALLPEPDEAVGERLRARVVAPRRR